VLIVPEKYNSANSFAQAGYHAGNTGAGLATGRSDATVIVVFG